MKEIYMEVKNCKKIGVIIFIATAAASQMKLADEYIYRVYKYDFQEFYFAG